MAEQVYILFDFGASHGRCMAAKFDGRKVVMEQIHEFENIPVNYAGVLYWDILRLTNELKVGLKKAHSLYPQAKSIGINSWGCDFGYIDKKGKLLASPVNYRDEARYRYKKDMDNLFGGEYEVFRLGGANTINIMGVYELYANKREDSSALREADKLLMIPDLFNYYLSGIATNEYTNATMTLMVDQVGKKWERKFIESLQLPGHLFGELAMPGTQVGLMHSRVAKEFDMPALPVINVATHDTAGAIAGVPLISSGNWAFLSLGTWAILGVESEKVYLDEKTFRSGFANQGGCENKNNFVNLFSGLWVIQQCYERWCEEAGKRIGWEAVSSSIADAKGGESFIDTDAGDFAQPKPNMPLFVQEYCEKHGMRAPQGMGEIARCINESLILKVKNNYHKMLELIGSDIEVLYLFGGGSKNRFVCQGLADALGVEVKAGPAETTSVGNALMQMKAAGDISNLAEGREISAVSAKSDIVTYYPQGGEKWAQYYERYLKILGE